MMDLMREISTRLSKVERERERERRRSTYPHVDDDEAPLHTSKVVRFVVCQEIFGSRRTVRDVRL